MSDAFTDTPDYSEDFQSVEEPAATVSPVPTQEPVFVIENPIDDEISVTADPSPAPIDEPVEGTEEVSGETPIVVDVDITELLEELKTQHEQIVTLTEEAQKSNAQLSSILNAFPVLTFLLSLVLGSLLVKILSSYLKA